MASYLINHVPCIEDKRYLELGVHQGSTFHAVLAGNKTSVDAEHPADFKMSTDAFFDEVVNSNKYGLSLTWDVIYIDACHEYRQVVRDYNNSIRHLTKHGIIFLHDLVPPDEDHTKQHYCGDAYRLLYQWLMGDADPKFYTLNNDYGLTAVVGSFQPVVPSWEVVQYEQFRSALSQIRLYSVAELQQILKEQSCEC